MKVQPKKQKAILVRMLMMAGLVLAAWGIIGCRSFYTDSLNADGIISPPPLHVLSTVDSSRYILSPYFSYNNGTRHVGNLDVYQGRSHDDYLSGNSHYRIDSTSLNLLRISNLPNFTLTQPQFIGGAVLNINLIRNCWLNGSASVGWLNGDPRYGLSLGLSNWFKDPETAIGISLQGHWQQFESSGRFFWMSDVILGGTSHVMKVEDKYNKGALLGYSISLMLQSLNEPLRSFLHIGRSGQILMTYESLDPLTRNTTEQNAWLYYWTISPGLAYTLSPGTTLILMPQFVFETTLDDPAGDFLFLATMRLQFAI